MRNWIKIVLSLVMVMLVGCGFHLRGEGGSFQFPYKKSYLQCANVIICSGLQRTIQAENLTTLVKNKESAEAVIIITNEQTSRDANNFNSVGQISGYLLTYQVTAQVYTPKGDQIGNDIVVQNQMVMAYNNSLILSAQQQEETTWDQIHQNVINSLIRRIVYSHPLLISPNVTESK
ncbi:MAG: hypothetical protein K2X04_09900 [Burkholderiales bacterium]|jgi:LPS-assembly lipoprotein|nr:hypothetical protein [Burkholderiales bacterium]